MGIPPISRARFQRNRPGILLLQGLDTRGRQKNTDFSRAPLRVLQPKPVWMGTGFPETGKTFASVPGAPLWKWRSSGGDDASGANLQEIRLT